MTDAAGQIQETLSLYGKHGWTPRRVLLTERLKNALAGGGGGGGSLETLFGAAEVVQAEIDAVWFSRLSGGGGGREAWEIRHLRGTPYALVEVFDAEDEEEVREERRHELEEQLKERVMRVK